jgi:amino acid transporter
VIGNSSGAALVAPRLTYALAERKEIPAVFGRLNPSYGTPVASIILFAVVTCLLSITGQFIWLATISVVGRLANYLVTCVALPVLRRRASEPPAFKIPFGTAISVAGILLCIWLLAQVSWSDLRAFALACLAGALLYLVNRAILVR